MKFFFQRQIPQLLDNTDSYLKNEFKDPRIEYSLIQLNFGISNTDVLNTTNILRYTCGPGHFYHIRDLKKKTVCQTQKSRIPCISRNKFMAQVTKRRALS